MDYLHYGVGGAPLTADGVGVVLDFLDRYEPGKVLVHCRKGGRAAALVLLHQARAHGWTADEALARCEALGLKLEGNLRSGGRSSSISPPTPRRTDVPSRTLSLPDTDEATMLAHTVFFTLKDRSDIARAGLINACKRYLTGHPGTVFFAVGVLEPELNRDVNDRDFDVALHLVFESRAAHDAYQDAPRHRQFVEENKENWAKVRVFDSALQSEA